MYNYTHHNTHYEVTRVSLNWTNTANQFRLAFFNLDKKNSTIVQAFFCKNKNRLASCTVYIYVLSFIETRLKNCVLVYLENNLDAARFSLGLNFSKELDAQSLLGVQKMEFRDD